MYSQKKLLPVGEENFAYIRRNNLYYVDKTQLIEKLLTNWGKANYLQDRDGLENL